MKKALSLFKEFELSDLQKLITSGGFFFSSGTSGGLGNNTYTADSNTQVGQSNTYDVDTNGAGCWDRAMRTNNNANIGKSIRDTIKTTKKF